MLLFPCGLAVSSSLNAAGIAAGIRWLKFIDTFVPNMHRRIHQGGRGGPDPPDFYQGGSVYDLDPLSFLTIIAH